MLEGSAGSWVDLGGEKGCPGCGGMASLKAGVWSQCPPDTGGLERSRWVEQMGGGVKQGKAGLEKQVLSLTTQMSTNSRMGR